MQQIILLLSSVLVFFQCMGPRTNRAQEIVEETLRAHGSSRLLNAQVSFTFRDKKYSATRTNNQYIYTRLAISQGDTIKDILVNSTKLTRLINGDTINLPDSTRAKYASSVNSVLYFIQMPYPLLDQAARKTYKGSTTINGEGYDLIKVTFSPQGGGEDYQDEYMYWINQHSKKLDYLAYSYHTNGGGVRFREAFNRVERNGILFQDYINYKAPTGTSLIQLPLLFETGKLKELSRIVNEDISVKTCGF